MGRRHGDRSNASSGEAELMKLPIGFRRIGIGARVRWFPELLYGALTVICLGLSLWTGYDRFNPQGREPLSALASLLRAGLVGLVMFLGYTLWPSEDE